MRRSIAFLTAVLLGFCGAAQAGDRAGDFDYYVLSLGWSASWCALTGDARGDAQCDAGRGLTFTLHGLWPQNETGFPQDCYSDQADASKSQTAAMAGLMGASSLAWHEWKKHGRCSGLSAAAYFDDARRAYESVNIPDLFTMVSRDLTLPASVIEDAFLEANPALNSDEITVTCDQGKITEVRVCLTKDLAPRPCGTDVARECTLKSADLPPVR